MDKQEEITIQEKCPTNWSYLPCTMGKAQAIVSPFPRDEGDRTLYLDEEKMDDAHHESSEPDSHSCKINEDKKQDEEQTSGSDDVSVLVVDETMCEDRILQGEEIVPEKKVPDDSLLEKLDSFQNYSLSQTFTLHQSFQAILSDIKQQEMMAGCQELQEDTESSVPSQMLNANVVMLSSEQKPMVNLGQLSSDGSSGAGGEVLGLCSTVQGKLPMYMSHDTGGNITISHLDGKIIVEKNAQKDFTDGHQQVLPDQPNPGDPTNNSANRADLQFLTRNNTAQITDTIPQNETKIKQEDPKQTNVEDQFPKKNDVLNFRPGFMDFQQFNLISNQLGTKQSFVAMGMDQPRPGLPLLAPGESSIQDGKPIPEGSLTQSGNKETHFPGSFPYDALRNIKKEDSAGDAGIHKDYSKQSNQNLTEQVQEKQLSSENQSSESKNLPPVTGWTDSSMNYHHRPPSLHPTHHHPHHQPPENQPASNPPPTQSLNDDKSGHKSSPSVDSSHAPVLGWGNSAFNLIPQPHHPGNSQPSQHKPNDPPRNPWGGDSQGQGGPLHPHFRFLNARNDATGSAKPQIIKPEPRHPFQMSQIFHPNFNNNPYPLLGGSHDNKSFQVFKKEIQPLVSDPSSTTGEPNPQTAPPKLGEPFLQKILPKPSESNLLPILPKPDQSYPKLIPKSSDAYPQITISNPVQSQLLSTISRQAQSHQQSQPDHLLQDSTQSKSDQHFQQQQPLIKQESKAKKSKRKRQATPEQKHPFNTETLNPENTPYFRHDTNIKFENGDENMGRRNQQNPQDYFPMLSKQEAKRKDNDNQNVLINPAVPVSIHSQAQRSDKIEAPPNQFPFLMKDDPGKRMESHQSYLMQLSNLRNEMNPPRPEHKHEQENNLTSTTNTGQASEDQAASSGKSVPTLTHPIAHGPPFTAHSGGTQLPSWFHRNPNPNSLVQNPNQIYQPPPIHMFPYSQPGHSQGMIMDLRQSHANTAESSNVPKQVNTKQGTNLHHLADNYDAPTSTNPSSSSSSLSSTSKFNHNPHLIQESTQLFSNPTSRPESASASATSKSSIVNSIPIGLTPIAPKLQPAGGAFLSSDPFPKLALSPGVGGLAESTPKTQHHIKRSGLLPNNGLENLPDFPPDFPQGIKKSTLTVSPTNFNLESGILTDPSPENKRHQKRQKLSPLHFPPGFSGRISPFSEHFLQPPQAHQQAHHTRHTSPTGFSAPPLPGSRQSSPSGLFGHHSPVGMDMFPNVSNPYQSFYNPNQMYPPNPYLAPMGHQQQNPMFPSNPMYPPYPIAPGHPLPSHHHNQMPPPFALPQQSRDYGSTNEQMTGNNGGGSEGLNLSLVPPSKPRHKQIENQTSDEQRLGTKDVHPQISPKINQQNPGNRLTDLPNMELPEPSPAMSSHVTTSDVGETTKRKGRINYSSHQLSAMDSLFNQNPYPGADTLDDLSSKLDIPTSKLKVWFQNKRARARKKGGNKNLKLPPTTNNILYNNIKTSSHQPSSAPPPLGHYPPFYNHGNQVQHPVSSVTTSTSSNTYSTSGIHGNSLPYSFDHMKPPQVP